MNNSMTKWSAGLAAIGFAVALTFSAPRVGTAEPPSTPAAARSRHGYRRSKVRDVAVAIGEVNRILLSRLLGSRPKPRKRRACPSPSVPLLESPARYEAGRPVFHRPDRHPSSVAVQLRAHAFESYSSLVCFILSRVHIHGTPQGLPCESMERPKSKLRTPELSR